MNRVLRVNAEDLTVTVQAGVTRKQLNREIKDTGLFFPIDPGADASIGGMAATRASGTNAVRYGTMRENVLGLTVVTANGEVIRTGTRARKSSAGYDLTRLFVGSEGTLGVMTEITLKLYPLPEAVIGGDLPVPERSMRGAARRSRSSRWACRSRAASCSTRMPCARSTPRQAGAARSADAADGVPRQRRRRQGAGRNGAGDRARARRRGLRVGDARRKSARKLWTARHHAYFAALQTKPGCRCVTTDTCVPISRLAECIDATVAEADASGLPYFIVGHVGDGNFHFGYLDRPDSCRKSARPPSASTAQLVARALALEGTCTGEHGIGLHKMAFLVDEAGAGAVAMMRSSSARSIRTNIMNPGKIFALPHRAGYHRGTSAEPSPRTRSVIPSPVRTAAFLMVAVTNPALVGAVVPSSRRLAAAMAEAASGAGLLIDLGAGTGAITAALRERHPDVPLVAVEMQLDSRSICAIVSPASTCAARAPTRRCRGSMMRRWTRSSCRRSRSARCRTDCAPAHDRGDRVLPPR